MLNADNIFAHDFTDAEIAAFVNQRIPCPPDEPHGKVRLSVVVPSFNQAAYLRQTLNSIANQHYPNLELIVLDGGSTDGSLEIIKEYEDIISHFESGPDGGQAAALNKGFAMATGDIIAWQNSDDLYLPGFFRALEAAVGNYPDAEFLIANCYVVDPSGRIQSPTLYGPFCVEYLSRVNWNVTSQSAFVSRSLVRSIEPMKNIKVAFDRDGFIRVGRKASAVGNIKPYGGAYRNHPDSKLSVVKSNERDELMRGILADLGFKVAPGVALSKQWPLRRKLLTFLMRMNRTLLYGRLGTPRFVTVIWRNLLGLCGYRLLGY
jgi:glycosyltransferase involved in cell wall biosynthesis